ncbi:MAG: peptidoglycan-binding protein [Butyricicoccus sp.]|nr:peptidoglycan-binding protein [Butyricicoccus sp.]
MAIRWILDEDGDDRRTLKRGMFGADVTEAQNLLRQLGYDLGPYGVDGDFGSATEDAVKAFQVNVSLPETGIVDDATWEKLDKIASGKGDTDEEVAPPEETGTLAVKDGTWNIRTGPGTEYPIVKTTHTGDKLVEINPDGWVPVKVNGEVCWISPKALK